MVLGIFFGLIISWEIFTISLTSRQELPLQVGTIVVVDEQGMVLTQSHPLIRWSTDYSLVASKEGEIVSADVNLQMYEVRYASFIAWFPAVAVRRPPKRAKLVPEKAIKRTSSPKPRKLSTPLPTKQLPKVRNQKPIDFSKFLQDDDQEIDVTITVDGTMLQAVAENESEDGVSDEQKQCFTAVKNGDKVTFRSRFGTFLAIGSGGGVAIDRIEARSFESFVVVPKKNKKATFTLHVECPPSICGKPIRRYLSRNNNHKIAGSDVSSSAVGVSFSKCRKELGLTATDHTFSSDHIPKITIFATLKPVSRWDDEGFDEAFFENSIFAWQQLPFKKRYVLSEDADTRDLASSKKSILTSGNVRIVDRYHVPTYRSIFNAVLELEKTGFFVYANIDLVFTSTLVKTIAAVSKWCKEKGDADKILIVGRRFNKNFKKDENLSLRDVPDWEKVVESLKGGQWQEDAVDYFIVTPDTFDFTEQGDIPKMVVGGTAFDNWLLQKGLTTPDVTVIDATATVTALHQTPPGDTLYSSHKNPQSEYNHKLGEAAGGWAKGKVTQSPYATFWYGDDIVIHKRGVLS
eukprot:TRINITY_DN21044_c0_g1_i1.p1 TRINITY_DN21044_c0_g1~~TRINITY_DN21044_c0_g1_i1.p1  ORF type:complete len:604 (+),score=94.43 TRINITY_DN21044_c0_g1_i1:88-1812(+)